MNTITEQKKWRVSKAMDMKYGEPYIQCRYGVIRQYSDGDLDVWVTSVRMANLLSRQWKPKKEYDDGALFIRPFSDLDTACSTLKARKRRKVTDQMRLRGRLLAERVQAAKAGIDALKLPPV